jgi:hypothetical protein
MWPMTNTGVITGIGGIEPDRHISATPRDASSASRCGYCGSLLRKSRSKGRTPTTIAGAPRSIACGGAHDFALHWSYALLPREAVVEARADAALIKGLLRRIAAREAGLAGIADAGTRSERQVPY